MKINDIDETIVALSSPPGGAGRAIVRLSGPDSLACARQCFEPVDNGSPWQSHRRIFGHFRVGDDGPSVGASAYYLAAPKSYSAQDMVEFHLPGSPALARMTVDILCNSGARLAGPGEFTMRAFLLGRLDLAQAEAVEALIGATDEAERSSALAQVEGEFSNKVRHWRDELIAIAADVESQIDFEEEEVGPEVIADLEIRLRSVLSELVKVISSAHVRAMSADGIPVYFAGLTNAGKSSLVNALLGRDAAVVSSEISTTRDRLEFEYIVEPFHFILQDAPGHDTGTGAFSTLSSRRAESESVHAGVVVLVVDSSTDNLKEVEVIAEKLPDVPVVVALNKSDLDENCIWDNWLAEKSQTRKSWKVIRTSARRHDGVEELRSALVDLAVNDVERISGQKTFTLRVMEELTAASKGLEAARQLLAGNADMVLLAEELRTTHQALAHVMGEGYAEEVLESIFSRFCIGK